MVAASSATSVVVLQRILLVLILFGLGCGWSVGAANHHQQQQQQQRQQQQDGTLNATPNTNVMWLFDARPMLEKFNGDRRAFYEAMHLLSGLAALANRNGPRLYILLTPSDESWLTYLTGGMYCQSNQPGNCSSSSSSSSSSMDSSSSHFLGNVTIVNMTSIEALLTAALDPKSGLDIKGAVVYDQALPSTSNLASTAVGVEDLLPFCFRSNTSSPTLYDRFVVNSSDGGGNGGGGGGDSLSRDVGGGGGGDDGGGGGATPLVHNGINIGNSSGGRSGSRSGGGGGGGVIASTTPRLSVRRWLNASMFTGAVTGSRKGDAYTWAAQTWLSTGLANASIQGFFIDYYWAKSTPCCGGGSVDLLQSTVSNQDWVMAQRGFVWDLNVWPDDVSNDDPLAPNGTDLRVLETVLGAAYNQTGGKQMIHIAGFTPWAYKYVTPFGKHQGVDTEWQTVKIVSTYNAFLDGDACCIAGMANAALYRHMTLPERLLPLPMPQPAELCSIGALTPDSNTATATDTATTTTTTTRSNIVDEDEKQYSVVPNAYGFFYAGDYDAAAWLYGQWRSKWDDPARGSVPIGWAVDPELSLRFPPAFQYMHETRTANDIFICGDSGAGYLNPTQLYPPGRPSSRAQGGDVWANWNGYWYRRFGLSFSGFLINGASGPMTPQAEHPYGVFSYNGVTEQRAGKYQPYALRNNGTLPVFHEAMDVVNFPNASAAAAAMCANVDPKALAAKSPQFMMFRTILETATTHADIVKALAIQCPQLKILSPHAAAYLARVALGGDNNNIITWLDDTFPSEVRPSATLKANVLLRNDGWNALSASSFSLQVSIAASVAGTAAAAAEGKMPSHEPLTTLHALPETIFPGDNTTVTVSTTAPSIAGIYTLSYQLISTKAVAPAKGGGSTNGDGKDSIKSYNWEHSLHVLSA